MNRQQDLANARKTRVRSSKLSVRPSRRRDRRYCGADLGLQVDRLEERTLLAVTASLSNGVLDVALSGQGDSATLTGQGGSIAVSDGMHTSAFAAGAVDSIKVHEDAPVELPGLGTSAATFAGTIDAPGGIAATGLDAITVAAGATLSTRAIAANADPTTAASTAASGGLALAAKQVTVAAQATVTALGNNGFAGGDIALAAADQASLAFVPGSPFRDVKTAAGVDIADGASILGRNVAVTSFATTSKIVANVQETPASTRAMLLADVNGDGKPDLLLADAGQPVRLYLNNGTATPYDVAPILIGDQDAGDTSEGSPTALAVGDLDGDKLPDVVVGYGNAPVKVFTNRGGSIPFAGEGTALGGNNPTTALAIGDLDGDGKPDVIVGGTDVPVLVYRDGDPNQPVTLGGGSQDTTSLALGDLDGDGKPDLVVGNDGVDDPGKVGTHTSVYYLNQSGGGGVNLGSPIAVGGSGLNTRGVALADLDGDGRLDLVLANAGAANTFVLNRPAAVLGTATAAAPVRQFQGSTGATAVAVGDLDGNGKVDVLFGRSGKTNQVYLNDGQASFANPVDLDDSTLKTTALVAGDLDGNGTIDVIQATDGGGTSYYANDGGPAGSIRFEPALAISALDPQLLYSATSLPQVGPLDLNGLTLFGGAVLAEARAHLTVGAARITASNGVSLLGNALANAEISTVGMSLAVGIGRTTASTDVTVGRGAVIIAGGLYDQEANSNNTLVVSLVNPTQTIAGQENSGNLTIAFGQADSHSDAAVAAGATVTAGAAKVLANNTNSFSTSTLNITTQASGDTAVGASLVIADYQSDASATVDGTLHAGGDVAIDATSADQTAKAGSSASILNKLQDGGFLKTVGGKISTLGAGTFTIGGSVANIGATEKGQVIEKFLNLAHGDTPNFDLAASIAIERTTNAADARIGAGADVMAGGKLDVLATATTKFQAGSSASSGGAQKASVGGALLFAAPSNAATAHIDANAQADAVGAMTVHADAEMPNVVNFLGLNAYIPNPNDPETSDPKNVVSQYGGVVQGLTLIPGDIITGVLGILATGSVIGDFSNTYTAASGGGDGPDSVGLAGSLNLLFQSNSAGATIGNHAKIDQRTTGATQDVAVTANATVESIDPNGPLSVLGVLGKGYGGVAGTSEGYGIGGTLFLGRFANSAVATVGDGAKVSAGRNVDVEATSFDLMVGAAQAGDQSSEGGFQASVSGIVLATTTAANVSDEATIDAGGDLTVNAFGQTEVINFTGGLTASANVGAGVSGTFTVIDDTTTATIGGGNPSDGTPGSIKLGGNLVVTAKGVRDVVAVGVSAASAVGGNASTPTDSSGSVDGLDAVAEPLDEAEGVVDETGSTGSFGVEVNGTVALNLVTTDTEATVSGPRSIIVGGAGTIQATSDAVEVGAGGGAVLAKNAGFNGEYVQDYLDATTRADLDDSTFRAGQALVVAATASAVIASASAGAVAGKGGTTSSFAGDGSAVFTPVLDDTEAAIGGATSVTAAGVAVAATNTLRILPVAGAAAVAAGAEGRASASVGGALNLMLVDETVLATIGAGAVVNAGAGAGGNVAVQATSADDIVALDASFAANGGTLAANGSGLVLVFDQEIAATIGNGASVATPDSVYVGATDSLDKVLLAGGGAGAQDAGFGASAAVDFTARTIAATIGSDARVDAGGGGAGIPDDGSGQHLGVAVNAAATDKTLRVAINGAAAAGGDAGLAAAASLTLGSSVSTVAATIGDRAQIDANATGRLGQQDARQSVRVSASHQSLELAVAGGLAVVIAQDGGGLGAASADSTLDKTVTAAIGNDAVVRAADDVLVTAASVDRLVGFTVGLAGAATLAAAGSLQVYTLPTHVAATIGDRANVRAAGSVAVLADNVIQVAEAAGQAAASAQAEEDGVAASVGASITTTIINATTDAHIGASAVVEGLGRGDAVAAPTGQKDTLGANQTTPTGGVIVAATAAEDLTTATIAGEAAGANNGVAVALAGSATANVLNLATTAAIDQSAVINADTASAANGEDVVVLASDRTRNLTAAGSLSASVAIPTNPEEPFAASASGSAGADAVVVHKATSATIAASAQVHAGDSVAVRAISAEESLLVSLAAGISVGPSLAIAGSAGIGVFVLDTEASIGAGALVVAQGNVQVAADDATSTALGVANGTLAGLSGGASIGAFVITPTTLATVGDGATVIGRGLRGTITAENGQFAVQPVAYRAGTESFVPPAVQATLPQGIDPSSTLPAQLDNDLASTASTTTLRGVAVTANDTNESRRFAAGLAVGGVAGTPVVSVEVIVAATRATVGNNAQINPGNASDALGQSVLIAAGSRDTTLTVAGTFSAGSFGASPTADVAVLKLDTEATVEAGATIRARQDVVIDAEGSEDTLGIDASGSGAYGGVALAGTVGALFLDDATTAAIGNGATVSAGGNVVVAANDATRASSLVGTASYNGAGASIGVTPIVKDTSATIGANAIIDAVGNSPNAVAVAQGTIANHQFPTTNVRGLIVEAGSSETLFTLTAAGAVGGFSLAGSISAEVVDATTQAAIGNGAQINQDSTGATVGQSVDVVATDSQKSTAVDGTLSAGSGIGGAVDVGLFRANTSATIGDNAVVAAAGSVAVAAAADKDLTSVVAGVAIGGFGLGAAVTVLGVDGLLGDSTAHDPNDATHTTAAGWLTGNNKTPVGGAVDGQVAGDGSLLGGTLGKLGSYSDPDEQQLGDGASQAEAMINAALPTNTVAAAIGRTDAAPGVSARIGAGVRIQAARNVAVVAHSGDTVTQGAGVLSVGLTSPIIPSVSLGASVSVAVIGTSTQATIGGNTQVAANAAGQGGSVTVDAQNSTVQQGVVASGTLNTGGYGLNATVAIANDHAGELAGLGDGVAIGGARVVAVTAAGTENLSSRTVGVAVGLQGAVGASIASATVDGATTARLGANDSIFAGSAAAPGSLTVSASATTPVVASATAAAAGVGFAAQGTAALAQAAPAVTTEIGAGSSLNAYGDASVRADRMGNVAATALGISIAGLTGGVAVATASNSAGVVQALVDPHASITPTGQVTIAATSSGMATAAGQAVAGALAGGVGVRATADASPTVLATVGAGSLLSGSTISLLTQSNMQANARGFGLAVGALDLGVVFATATASPTVTTAVGSGATLIAGSALAITANHAGSAVATGNAPGGGIVGGQGAVTNASASATTQALVNSGAVLTGGQSILVGATASNIARAQSLAISINLLAAVGASLATADASGTTKAEMAGTTATVEAVTPGAVTIQATSIDKAAATGDATSGGLLNGAGVDARATANPNVTADLATGALIRGVASLTIATNTTTNASATANGSSGSAIGVGVTLANASASPTVQDILAPGSVVQATGAVVIDNFHNLDNSADATSQLTDAGYGGIDVQYGSSQARAAGSFTIDLGAGSSIQAGADFQALANILGAAQAKASGSVGAALAYGSTQAAATNANRTRVGVDSGTSIAAGGAVGLTSVGSNRANAAAAASVRGVGSINGSIATATNTAGSTTELASASSVRAGANVEVVNDATLSSATAQADGETVGGVTVGNTQATATYSPQLILAIDAGASVQAGGSIGVLNQLVVAQGAQTAAALANGSNGSLIANAQGTSAVSSDTATTLLILADGSSLTAANDINLTDYNHGATNSNAVADYDGFVAEGETDADGTADRVNVATVGGTITAGGSFDFEVDTGDDGRVFGSGSAPGGFVSVSTVASVLTVEYTTVAQVNANAVITAGKALTVHATTATTAFSQAQTDASAFGVGAHVDSTIDVARLSGGEDFKKITENFDPSDESIDSKYADPTVASIGANARLRANTISVQADVSRTNARAFNYVTTKKAVGSADGDAVVGAVIPVLVQVDSGASLTAPTVDLVASYAGGIYGTDPDHFDDSFDQNLYNIETLANSSNYRASASAGYGASVVHNAQYTQARVVTAAGSTITTQHLNVDVLTPQIDVNSRSQFSGSFNVGRDVENDYRAVLADDSVDFNSTVILQPLAAVLTINPDGSIAQAQNIDVTQSGSRTIVNGVSGRATVVFHAESPAVQYGSYEQHYNGVGTYSVASFAGKPTFRSSSGVLIQDASNDTLDIRGLDTTEGTVDVQEYQDYGTTADDIYKAQYASPLQNSLPSPQAIVASIAGGPSLVTINKTGSGDIDFDGPILVGSGGAQNRLAAQAASGNILVNGSISVAGGSLFLGTRGGAIEATTAGSLEASVVNFYATGDIGVAGSSAPLALTLDQASGSAPSLQFSGNNVSLALGVHSSTVFAQSLALPATSSARGDFTLADAGGIFTYQYFTGSGFITMTIPAPLTYAVGGLSVGGTATLSLKSGDTLALGGPLAAGTAVDVDGGTIADTAGAATPVLVAPAATLLGTQTIGAGPAPLVTQLGQLTTQSSGDQFVHNVGDLVVASTPDGRHGGMTASNGQIGLAVDGVLTLGQQTLGGPITALNNLTIAADSIASPAPDGLASGGLLAISLRRGGVASASQPLMFSAPQLALTAGPAARGDIYLGVNGSTSVQGIDVLAETLWLSNGVFDDESHINALAENLTSGTLRGSGTVSGPLTSTFGTVEPGQGTVGTLHTGPVTFNPGSTFEFGIVPIYQGSTATVLAGLLASNGAVALNGAALVGFVAGAVPHGASVTIIQGTAITGQFAQGTQVVLGGQTFQIIYNPTSVVLVADRAPVAVAKAPASIQYGNSLTLDGSASTDPDGDALTYSWTVNGHAGAATGVNPTLTAGQLAALGVAPGSTIAVSLTVSDGFVSTTSAPVAVAVNPSAPATLTSVALSWGNQTAALVSPGSGSNKLLPAGRQNTIAWLNVNALTITTSFGVSLAAGDITLAGKVGVAYSVAGLVHAGNSWTIQLATPISKGDRITVTIGNATLLTTSFELDILPGDVNDDGVVNSADAVTVQNMIANNIPLTISADVNGDGVVDSKDLSIVRQKVGTRLP